MVSIKDKSIKLIKAKGKKERGILFSVPSHRGVPSRECMDAMKMNMQYLASQGWRVVENWTTGANIGRQRCTAVEEAKKAGVAYLMFIDDDMVFAPNAVAQLLDRKKEIVSGLCVKKTFPHNTTVSYFREDLGKYQQIWDFTVGDLLEVDGTGTAFMLIDMEVFDKIEKPYFSFCPRKYMDDCESLLDLLNKYQTTSDGVERFEASDNDSSVGEDYYFCKLAKDAGYKIYVDTAVDVGHLGTYAYSYADTIGVVELMKEKGQPVGDELTPKARVAT